MTHTLFRQVSEYLTAKNGRSIAGRDRVDGLPALRFFSRQAKLKAPLFCVQRTGEIGCLAWVPGREDVLGKTV